MHAGTCNSIPQTLIDQLTFAAYPSVPMCAAAQYPVAVRREASQQDAALSSRTPLQNDTKATATRNGPITHKAGVINGGRACIVS